VDKYKKCSKCGVWKSVKSFGKDSKTQSGLKCQCKECRKKVAKVYQEKNKKIIAAKARIYSQRYYQNNKDYCKALIRKWKDRNPDKVREQERRHRQTDKSHERQRAYQSKRRALKRKCSNIQTVDLQVVLERDNYICQLCGRKTRPDYNQYHTFISKMLIT